MIAPRIAFSVSGLLGSGFSRMLSRIGSGVAIACGLKEKIRPQDQFALEFSLAARTILQESRDAGEIGLLYLLPLAQTQNIYSLASTVAGADCSGDAAATSASNASTSTST